MTTSTLYNLDVPDEQDELDLKDADPKELIKCLYEHYVTSTGNYVCEATNFHRNIFYGHACKITARYADTLVEVLKEKQAPLKILNRNKMATMYKENAASIFLSAIVNQSTKKVIECNIESNMHWLAICLPEDKIFVNYGKTNHNMGRDAKGIVINYGEAGVEMGYHADGAMINCGRADKYMGNNTSGLVINFGRAGEAFGIANKNKNTFVINCGFADDDMGVFAESTIIAVRNPKDFGYKMDTKLLLDEDECKKMPELTEYFDDLKAVLDAGRNDCRALEKFPSSRKIRDDVEAILKKRGYLK